MGIEFVLEKYSGIGQYFGFFYAPSPILKGIFYYYYSGRTSKNEFLYFEIPKESEAGRLCLLLSENTTPDFQYITICNIENQCKQDALIVKKTGIEAYLMYWNDCLNDGQKLSHYGYSYEDKSGKRYVRPFDGGFRMIFHFEALKEWYLLLLSKRIDEIQAEPGGSKQSKENEILNWKGSILKACQMFLEENASNESQKSGITFDHANELIKFHAWLTSEISSIEQPWKNYVEDLMLPFLLEAEKKATNGTSEFSSLIRCAAFVELLYKKKYIKQTNTRVKTMTAFSKCKYRIDIESSLHASKKSGRDKHKTATVKNMLPLIRCF